ncbi:geranylgeranyl pyrophosphate synthetase [Truncatella angustata]|uniref:Geranylgeranyl pyrophosphate synthetase n=1 Tax=Truncatella angustata TaxID=152316 RepID=A0A9P8U850_9PEZI|nr:geranylgeranyl pyrophosphate synthetase [Truncatella angustata]KAH6643423.1 geranylgeranyl pyrophosphate synthetase [Truncatella angustata]
MSPKTILLISRHDIQGDSSSATITNSEYVASYSWIESKAPTIAVPGIPPKWSPLATPRRLPKDCGLIYIAQNAARHPESPLEPLFRALFLMKPEFDVRNVDLVSDRNNLRKLLTFVDPSSSRNGLEAFTINIEVRGNTIIFARTESKTKEVILPHEFKGYGHEFEKAYTDSPIKNSTGHHRIITYGFAGLKLLVRYEVDGKKSSKMNKEGDLADLLGSMSISATIDPYPLVSTTNKPATSKLMIQEQGSQVPAESILEIKTRVAHKLINASDIAPQLWVSQTPKLVRAYHRNGIFQQPQVEDMTDYISAWERRNQDKLRKLATLIKEIISAAKRFGGSAELRYEGLGYNLMVKKVERDSMLPDDLHAHWYSTTSSNDSD